MIWVLTVHHKSDRWVKPQRAFLDRWITEPYRLHTVTDVVDPADFDRVIEVGSSQHHKRLDALARDALRLAGDDDLFIFLDSDAFPIAPFLGTVRAALDAGNRLVAVRRTEGRIPWPHPSFCSITAKSWVEIGGTWSPLDYRPDPTLAVKTDVGAGLLKILSRRGEKWLPLDRTNTVGDPPYWCAIYGGVIYHHGAGSRRRLPKWTDEQLASHDAIFDRLCADPEFWRELL